MKADLHCHSISSDGTKTTKELFEIAKEQKIDILAITDHDICVDVEEKIALANNMGLQYIPAIELSTLEQRKPVHVLGYFKDDSYNNNEMITYYRTIKEGRENRTKRFVENLDKFFDIKITYEDVKSFSNGIIARPHIAKAINKVYPQYSFDYIFDNYIGDQSIAYVPSTELSVQEGIELLKRNNCVIVLAHPTLLKDSIKDVVLNYQYDGIEAKYYRNNEGDEEQYRQLAKMKDIIITGGSDYHGIHKDSKHGYLGEVFIEGIDLIQFMEKYNKKVTT